MDVGGHFWRVLDQQGVVDCEGKADILVVGELPVNVDEAEV